MDQPTFADWEYEGKKRKTLREVRTGSGVALCGCSGAYSLLL